MQELSTVREIADRRAATTLPASIDGEPGTAGGRCNREEEELRESKAEEREKERRRKKTREIKEMDLYTPSEIGRAHV